VQDVLVARRPTPRAEFLEMGRVQKDGNNLGSGPGRLHNPTNVDPADHTVTPYAVLLRTDTGDRTELECIQSPFKVDPYMFEERG
jgi:hypothetical protein